MATASSFTKAFVSRASTAPSYWLRGSLVKILATGVQTLNRCSLIYELKDKGIGSYTKINVQDQAFYILHGRCTFNVGAERGMKAANGDTIFIPRYTQYSYTVDQASTELLRLSTPGGLEQAVLGLASPAQDKGLPKNEVPLPPRQHIEALYEQYGINPIGGIAGLDPFEESRMATRSTAATSLKPFKTNAKTAQAYWASPMLPERWTPLVESHQSGGSTSLCELWFPKGNCVPVISYQNRDEAYYVLEGKGTIMLNSKVEEVGPGDFIYVAKNNIWAVRSDSDVLKVLTVHVPGGFFEVLLPYMAAPAEGEGLPPPGWKAPGQIDPNVGAAILDQFGAIAVAAKSPFA